MGSVSRSDVYHGIEEHEESYQYFDILKELTDPIDQAIKIPASEDDLFSNTEVPERSRLDKKRKIVTMKGTQELMFDRVKAWKPWGRTMDASCQDTPNLGTNKLDVILREALLGGELSIMALCEMKKLPAGNLAAKEFAPEEMGQGLEFGIKVMLKQPWRPHVYVGLSDTRRFKFFKISRTSSDFLFQHSDIFMDVRGWEVLRLLVCQTAETLGYVQCSIEGWTVGKILGIGGTAVVVEAHQSGQPSVASESIDAVAKLYSGAGAQDYRNQEAAALEALRGISNIPRLIQGAPATTVKGRPVLLKSPRGNAAGDGVFPLVSEYSPLVDVLDAVHRKGWLHNDVAPANIFFHKMANKSPKVFLNDFGSATILDARILPAALKSRPLYYSSSASSKAFDIGPKADLRALVLSVFVLTQKNAFDFAQVTTVTQLEEVVMRAQPWKDALIAAKETNYAGVKAALNSSSA
jgi:hypothetical protein